jgi:hypothetical protein
VSAKRAKETLRLLAENRRQHPEWAEETREAANKEPVSKAPDEEDIVSGEDE